MAFFLTCGRLGVFISSIDARARARAYARVKNNPAHGGTMYEVIKQEAINRAEQNLHEAHRSGHNSVWFEYD